MTRLLFLIAWLRGPDSFNRFMFFFVLVMLFFFYCLVGGMPHVPSSPAHGAVSLHAPMPAPKPIPANTAEELRKRIENGPHIKR